MSRRGSKSANFIASLSSNPKGKYLGSQTKKKGKNTRENISLSTPDGFTPEIKFYPKNVLTSKNKIDLINYYNTLIEKYKQLKLIIPKPTATDKIFEKMAYSPNIKKNIEKEALLPSIYETQIIIRNVEILNYLELQKKKKNDSKKSLGIINLIKGKTNLKKTINKNPDPSEFNKTENSDNKDNIRLSKLAKQLNISIKELVLLLKAEGFTLKNNPMAKVSSSAATLIIKKLNKIDSFTLAENTDIQKESSQDALIETKIANEKSNSIEFEIIPEEFNSLIIPTSLKELKEKINQIDRNEYVKSLVLQQFIRNEYVKEYARIRANGICELCEQKAPFNDINNKPFLEVHHIIWLSKGGEDSVDNVAGLCPNCHRRIHNLNSEIDLEKLLRKRRL